MSLFVLWVLLSALCGVYANSKNRSGMGYTFLSLVLSPVIGFVIVAIAGYKNSNI